MRARAPFDAGAKDINGLRGEDEVTVLEGPYTFRFSYYERKEGRERWVPRWTERDRLPELIRLEILGLGAGGGAMQPIVFRPRIDAEQACVKERRRRMHDKVRRRARARARSGAGAKELVCEEYER